MNIVFIILIISSIIGLTIINPESVLTTLISGTTSAINLSFTLIAIYAIWLSVIKIMSEIGLNRIIYKLFKPIVKRLFKGENELTYEYITLNFSANILGMGGAATPLGIKAIESMNKNEASISDNMILFAVINASSIQLLPTTIISLRSTFNSQNTSNIILPSILSTCITTIVGIALCYIFRRFKKKT